MGMLELLEERGYVNQIVGTREDLDTMLTEKRVGVYAGVDPTAPSLHIGHMVPFMALGWMYIHGYAATFLMGGFTAGIGDPIGRLTGREAQKSATKVANAAAMHQQLKKLGASMEKYAEARGYAREWAWRRSLTNNYAWWQKLPMNDFMKVLGVGTRIGPMLGRDTVKNRLESGEGMSFAEFTYPLCQAWDWWELYQKGTQIQIGGADQFGNILAGAEAVKYLMKSDPEYVAEKERTSISKPSNLDLPMGFTVPLLTTSSGEKFGKSAGNAIWLDPTMTPSFELYQFFLRSADNDVERYLKLFTFLRSSEIAEVMTEQRKDESKRVAQHKLASEFVELVHGKAAAQKAEQEHRQLFEKKLTLSDIQAQAKPMIETTPDGRPIDINPLVNKHAKPLDVHSGGEVNMKLPKSLVIQQPLSRILWSAGLVASRSEGQRMINNKGVYVGGRAQKQGDTTMGDALTYVQVEDSKWSTVSKFVIDENLLILRTGKWRVKVVTIVPDEDYEAAGLSCPGWKEEEVQVDPKINELDLHGEEKLRQEKHGQNANKQAHDKRRDIGHQRR